MHNECIYESDAEGPCPLSLWLPMDKVGAVLGLQLPPLPPRLPRPEPPATSFRRHREERRAAEAMDADGGGAGGGAAPGIFAVPANMGTGDAFGAAAAAAMWGAAAESAGDGAGGMDS